MAKRRGMSYLLARARSSVGCANGVKNIGIWLDITNWRVEMIIDTHSHPVTMDTERYPLADPNASYRPAAAGSMGRLKAEMDKVGVEKACTISAGFYGWDYSYAMDELRGREDWLVVGVLVDPARAQGPDELERLVAAGAGGIRIQRHLFYHQALDDPISTSLWAKAGELGLTVDINASQSEYGAVENRLQQFPETKFVLDHCGYVADTIGREENSVVAVVELAKYANAYAKLTFLESASREAYPFRDVHWMVREVIDAFGPERCMFGSNFPQQMYSPKMSYAQTLELFAAAIELSAEEREWILGGTAATLWRWG